MDCKRQNVRWKIWKTYFGLSFLPISPGFTLFGIYRIHSNEIHKYFLKTLIYVKFCKFSSPSVQTLKLVFFCLYFSNLLKFMSQRIKLLLLSRSASGFYAHHFYPWPELICLHTSHLIAVRKHSCLLLYTVKILYILLLPLWYLLLLLFAKDCE